MSTPTLHEACRELGILPDNLRPIKDFDSIYNCISWSVGVTDRWLWPGDTIDSFDKFYASYGYRRTNGSIELAEIVLYAVETYRTIPTHACRRDRDTLGWTSKLGTYELIWHPELKDIEGPLYGKALIGYDKE